VINANFVSHKRQQHLDGRRELDRTVNEMCANMTPLKRRVTYRLNPVTGQMVEVR
jgi:hypothetical protein